MKWQVIKIRVLQWLKRIFFYGLYSILVFFIIGFSILQIPAVQQSLIGKITDRFSKVSGFNVEFDRFYLLWYDRLEIINLKITDEQHRPMIEAGKLFVNFSLTNLYKKGDLYFDALALQEGAVNLVTVPETDSTYELNIDRFIAAINAQLSSGKGGGGGSGPKIYIGEVLVQQSRFSYNRPEKDSIRGFDYNHFNLALDEGNLDNFHVIGDTIEFNLSSLQVKDLKTDLTIKEFNTYFRISQLSMEFLGINLNCNQSHISDTIILKYGSQRDLNDFNQKVTIDAKFKNTKIYPQDIALFSTGFEKWKSPVLLNGHVTGKVSHFIFNPMEVSIGSSVIRGSIEMDGLPSIEETFMNINLKPSVIYASDFDFVLPDAVVSNLGPLNKINLHASFLGFLNDFVAKGQFDTRFGRIDSDINYKISDDDIKLSSYSGNLKLYNYDLGRYLNDTVTYQRVTLSGRIKGKGFNRKTADFVLIGEIPSIGILGYNYSDIRSNARFANQLFEGNLDINDPNLRFGMTGSIDLRDSKDLINVEARIDTALLHELKLTKREVALQSDIDIDSRGLQLDSIVGSVLLKNTSIRYKDESVHVDSVHIVSENNAGRRSLTLRSSMLDLSLAGDYYYSTMFNDIQRIGKEFLLNLENDPAAIKAYYESKSRTGHVYKAAIQANIHNLDSVFDMLDIDLHISPETKIEGEFLNNTTSILNVYSQIDSLNVSGQAFKTTEIEFSGSKIRDSTSVLAQLTINSEYQKLGKAVPTKDMFLECIWNRGHIDLAFDIEQDGLNNAMRMKSEIDFLEDSTKIRILPSQITLLGEPWEVMDQNYTLLKGEEWSIHHLGLRNEKQFVHINGDISRDPNKELKIEIQDFNLSLLNLFSTEKFKGKLNAEIVQRDIYQNFFIENVLTIDSLTVNNFLVGEVKGNNTRDPQSDYFNIDLTLDRLNYRIVDIKGYYNPKDKESPLHTKAILKKANLKLIEPVIRDIFSNMDGTLTGEYVIEGSFKEPRISGKASIEDGQIMINYMKTLYKVTGVIELSPGQIQFNDFQLIDGFKNKGRLEGYLAHRNFSKMRLNLNASFVNFNLLNTTIKDNSLFYGQAYGTGTLSIMGPASNLNISATARTNKNTRLSIPVGGSSGTEEKKDFIQFASFTETTKIKSTKPQNKRELSGLTMDLNVDVTPDAYVEIIFDIKSGDIIRGRGRGDIKMEVDTKGDFNMFGLVEFTEGAYNFTLYDIINKEFTIKPGSRITWAGNPYEGNLNITASYRQLTSVAPILSNQDPSIINDPQIKRRYPVEVLLKLDGPMLSPQITFDLEARDLPDNIMTSNGISVRPKFEFNAFKSRLDEQGLKLQVFSLIVLRKLSPPDAFTVSASASLYNSVSEVLSNQLSYWLSQVDQNLEIDLDLGTLDQEAFNTFQLRLSYSFLNGRLRVSKDGNFGGNQINRSELSTIAGDWTVDYLLTPDGKFKVKMYSRSSVNQLQSSLNSQTAAVTTGASFLYTENFNEFKDLLRSARERRRKELEKNPEPAEEESSDGTKGSH